MDDRNVPRFTLGRKCLSQNILRVKHPTYTWIFFSVSRGIINSKKISLEGVEWQGNVNRIDVNLSPPKWKKNRWGEIVEAKEECEFKIHLMLKLQLGITHIIQLNVVKASPLCTCNVRQFNKSPCVCSVTDHRWRQNVVRTKKWHTRRSRVSH